MFSDVLLEKIFCDERMRHIPLEYQSTVVHVVEDAMETRFYTEKPYMSKEERRVHQIKVMIVRKKKVKTRK